MNAAHWHLLLNHAPIFAALAGVLLLLAGLLRRQQALAGAGLLALGLAALVGWPALATGSGAAKIVKDMPRVSEALIHAHAQAARLGYYVLAGAAALALACGVLRRQPQARALAWAALVVGAVGFGLLARSANLGGEIHHPEIRAGFGTPDEL